MTQEAVLSTYHGEHSEHQQVCPYTNVQLNSCLQQPSMVPLHNIGIQRCNELTGEPAVGIAAGNKAANHDAAVKVQQRQQKWQQPTTAMSQPLLHDVLHQILHPQDSGDSFNSSTGIPVVDSVSQAPSYSKAHDYMQYLKDHNSLPSQAGSHYSLAGGSTVQQLSSLASSGCCNKQIAQGSCDMLCGVMDRAGQHLPVWESYEAAGMQLNKSKDSTSQVAARDCSFEQQLQLKSHRLCDVPSTQQADLGTYVSSFVSSSQQHAMRLKKDHPHGRKHHAHAAVKLSTLDSIKSVAVDAGDTTTNGHCSRSSMDACSSSMCQLASMDAAGMDMDDAANSQQRSDQGISASSNRCQRVEAQQLTGLQDSELCTVGCNDACLTPASERLTLEVAALRKKLALLKQSTA